MEALGWEALLALAVLVALAALVQGSAGLGLGLVSAPGFALLAPDALPVVLLLLGLPMALLNLRRERAEVDRSGFVLLTAGRAAGALAGTGLVVVIAERLVTGLLGAVLLAAAVLTVIGPAVRLDARSRLAAGALSGAMEATGGIGGPALALVYRDRPGPELRATLAATFVVGLTVTITLAAIAGRITAEHLVLAGSLLPAVVVGFLASRATRHRLEGRWLRAAVVAFAVIGAVALLT